MKYCTKSTVKAPKRRQRCCSDVFIVNLEHISIEHLQVDADWVRIFSKKLIFVVGNFMVWEDVKLQSQLTVC